MKHVYLLMTLALGFSTIAFAQRTADMRLITTYPPSGLVVVSANEDPDKQAAAWQQNDVQFAIKNLGPDDIIADDTAIAAFPDFGMIGEHINLAGINGIAVNDEVFLNIQGLPLVYEPAGITSSQVTVQQLCDTLWMVDANGDVIFDPDLSNNHTCNGVSVNVWYLDVSSVNKINGFSMDPNPAATQLNVVSTFNNARNASIIIRDIVGKTVLTKNLGYNLNGQQTFALDISNFVTGMYVIELNIDGNRITRQIQVQK